MNTKPLVPPYAALVIGIAAVSSSAIFVKLCASSPGLIAAYRLLFTVLLMVPFMIAARSAVRKSLKTFTKLDHWLCLVSGVFLAFHFITWFESLRYTSVASSVVLVSLQPLFTFAGSIWIFKERLSQKSWFGGSLAIFGSVVIGWGDFSLGANALYGDLLALFSAFLVSVYWLIGQHVRTHADSGTYTFLVYGFSTFTLFVYVLVRGEPLLSPPPMDWAWFLSLAVFPTLLGHSVFNWVIRWIPASVVSVSILGEAIGAAILAYFILGETVTLQQTVGGILLLAGIFLFNRYHQG
ncbi:DMT family transporter [Effusibacillus lacus]|uniref:EamA family transporter n=1 Tax=Effusibacillus lacus TaxID=1348429 RepID=A0A292YM53_9BACL|nr:DMT family transporter [Effusibacillus lacus]TCS72269.1 threonine/homoserine efflux transporter RhtA [Effusibacillus lacus]GAX90256.1 EamA family transporter [Effusibacillus lacus]